MRSTVKATQPSNKIGHLQRPQPNRGLVHIHTDAKKRAWSTPLETIMKRLVSTRKLALAFALSTAFAAPAALADIKIGLNVPLTGFAAADGNSAHIGAQLAVEKANAQGGINGEKIVLVVYDDQASAKEATPIATKLIERDKVVGAVSGSYSAATRP